MPHRDRYLLRLPARGGNGLPAHQSNQTNWLRPGTEATTSSTTSSPAFSLANAIVSFASAVISPMPRPWLINCCPSAMTPPPPPIAKKAATTAALAIVLGDQFGRTGDRLDHLGDRAFGCLTLQEAEDHPDCLFRRCGLDSDIFRHARDQFTHGNLLDRILTLTSR